MALPSIAMNGGVVSGATFDNSAMDGFCLKVVTEIRELNTSTGKLGGALMHAK
jgi:hypothetical protein